MTAPLYTWARKTLMRDIVLQAVDAPEGRWRAEAIDEFGSTAGLTIDDEPAVALNKLSEIFALRGPSPRPRGPVRLADLRAHDDDPGHVLLLCDENGCEASATPGDYFAVGEDGSCRSDREQRERKESKRKEAERAAQVLIKRAKLLVEVVESGLASQLSREDVILSVSALLQRIQ